MLICSQESEAVCVPQGEPFSRAFAPLPHRLLRVEDRHGCRLMAAQSAVTGRSETMVSGELPASHASNCGLRTSSQRCFALAKSVPSAVLVRTQPFLFAQVGESNAMVPFLSRLLRMSFGHPAGFLRDLIFRINPVTSSIMFGVSMVCRRAISGGWALVRVPPTGAVELVIFAGAATPRPSCRLPRSATAGTP